MLVQLQPVPVLRLALRLRLRLRLRLALRLRLRLLHPPAGQLSLAPLRSFSERARPRCGGVTGEGKQTVDQVRGRGRTPWRQHGPELGARENTVRSRQRPWPAEIVSINGSI